MEHKTVIVHLILNKLNHCNISLNTQNMHLNCAINWFESTNIMNRYLFVMKYEDKILFNMGRGRGEKIS